MTDQPNKEDATVDFSPLGRTPLLREQFEKAWREALRGGPEPRTDAYLGAFAEPERSALRADLEQLASDYRVRRARANEQTQAEDAVASSDTAEGGPGPNGDATCDLPPTAEATCAFAPDTKVEDGDRTSEFRPAPAESDGTLDYAAKGTAAAAALGATIDTAHVGDASFSLADPSALRDAADDQRVTGYEILEVLGRGAMGVVYKARQRGLKRVVALKMILAGGHASELELARFRTEAEAVAQLQHPNIVQVYEVGEQNGNPFLALEYVNGGSLQAKIAATPQPVLHAAQTVQVLAQAMDFAHRRGIIHRDLKPANIMLTQPRRAGDQESASSSAPLVEEFYGVPKIADFGLAKKLEEDGGQTRSGTILGTPSYMAPEQAEGKSKQVGPLADQYSLGAMLYELLTGRPPFRGETVWDTLEQVRTQEPVPPSQLQPKVPRDLETICLKCLQKEAPKRYADCATLADDLRRFVAGEPILARPVGAAERLWRWCRRNPRVAALAGAVFALLVAGIVGLVGFNLRLAREKAETELARQKAVDNEQIAQANERRAVVNEERALKAQAVADNTGALALDVLRDMLSKVQDKLGDIPNTDDVRQEIIEIAMQGARKAADDTKDQPGLGRIRVHAASQMGSILYLRRDYAKALEQYTAANRIARDWADSDPQNDKARGNVAATLISLGDLSLLKGDRAGAQKYFKESLRIRQDIHDHPRSRELRPAETKLALAHSYLRMAQFASNPFAAQDLSRQALELRRQAATLEPANLEAELDLATSYYQRGDSCRPLGQWAAALDNYVKAVAQYADLAPKQPRKLMLKKLWASACLKLGETSLRLQRPVEARAPFARAQEILKPLLDDDPRNGQLREQLFIAYYGAATALRADDPAAATGFRKALGLYEDRLQKNPQSVDYLIVVMLCRARLGEHAVAVGLAEQLRALAKGNPDLLLEVASGYALSLPAVGHGRPPDRLSATERDLQQRYTAKALEALHQMKAAGYRDWAGLETEPDLAPLHGNAEFQKLLEEYRRAYPLPKRPT